MRFIIPLLVALALVGCGVEPQEGLPVQGQPAFSHENRPALPLEAAAEEMALQPPKAMVGAFWRLESNSPTSPCEQIKQHVLNWTLDTIPVVLDTQEVVSPECKYLMAKWMIEGRFGHAHSDAVLFRWLREAAIDGSLEARMFIFAAYQKEEVLSPGERLGSIFADSALSGIADEAVAVLAAEGQTVDRLPEVDLPSIWYLKGIRDGDRGLLLKAAEHGVPAAQYELAREIRNETRKLTRDVVYWYRVAAFNGNGYASHNLGVWMLRAAAAESSVEAPEGLLDGGELVAKGVGHIAYAAMLGIRRSAEILSALSETAWTGGILDAEQKQYFANLQPVGKLGTDRYPEGPFSFAHRGGYHLREASLAVLTDESTSGAAVMSLRDKAITNMVAIDRAELWAAGDTTDQPVWQEAVSSIVELPACPSSAAPDGCPSVQLAALPELEAGTYYLRLVATGGAHIGPVPVFVGVADADVLLVHPDHTWQAYNSQGGGSLYVNPVIDNAYVVNLDRPVDQRVNQSYHNFRAGSDVVRWLMDKGVTVAQTKQSDLQDQPGLSKRFSRVVVVGHDEYWDTATRDFYLDVLNRGGKVLFLSGNTGWFKIAREERLIGINKGSNPVNGAGMMLEDTGLNLSRREPVDERIARITGTTYESGGYAVRYYLNREKARERGIAPQIYNSSERVFVIDERHPIARNADLKAMDSFCDGAGVVDIEVDGVPLIGPSYLVNYQWLRHANPTTQVVAGSYMFNPNYPPMNARPEPGMLHFSGLVTTARYGQGEVVTMGSMGAYRLTAGTGGCARFFDSLIDYWLG